MFTTKGLTINQAPPGVATAWMLATIGSRNRLNKRQVLDANISDVCRVVSGDLGIPLRVSSSLMYGATLLHHSQAAYLLGDTTMAQSKFNQLAMGYTAVSTEHDLGEKEQPTIENDQSFTLDFGLLPQPPQELFGLQTDDFTVMGSVSIDQELERVINNIDEDLGVPDFEFNEHGQIAQTPAKQPDMDDLQLSIDNSVAFDDNSGVQMDMDGFDEPQDREYQIPETPTRGRAVQCSTTPPETREAQYAEHAVPNKKRSFATVMDDSLTVHLSLSRDYVDEMRRAKRSRIERTFERLEPMRAAGLIIDGPFAYAFAGTNIHEASSSIDAIADTPLVHGPATPSTPASIELGRQFVGSARHSRASRASIISDRAPNPWTPRDRGSLAEVDFDLEMEMGVDMDMADDGCDLDDQPSPYPVNDELQEPTKAEFEQQLASMYGEVAQHVDGLYFKQIYSGICTKRELASGFYKILCLASRNQVSIVVNNDDFVVKA